jgi:hypothetical protein
VHDRLAIALAECAIEASAVVLPQVVPDEGLATKLVDTLENLFKSTFAFAPRMFQSIPCTPQRIRDREKATGIEWGLIPRRCP